MLSIFHEFYNGNTNVYLFPLLTEHVYVCAYVYIVPIITSSFKFRTRRAAFSSSKDERKEEKTPYQLVKKLQKKIRQFEEQFEKDKNFKVNYFNILQCCFRIIFIYSYFTKMNLH